MRDLTAAAMLVLIAIWASVAYPTAVLLGQGAAYRTWLWHALEQHVFTD